MCSLERLLFRLVTGRSEIGEPTVWEYALGGARTSVIVINYYDLR